jgi:hypothetical protein
LPTPAAPPAEARDAARPPLWHTLGLVTLLVLVAAVGTLSSLGRTDARAPGARIVSAYLPAVIVNAALALYVARVAGAMRCASSSAGAGTRRGARSST